MHELLDRLGIREVGIDRDLVFLPNGFDELVRLGMEPGSICMIVERKKLR
jgi:hypothetical protein